ncbi:hypothetical protein G9A89_012491 [Geosiphon pyriformis]|nr:hypothetical protein G9A89_012491 [Geosiphon pyriformis]
MIVYQLIPSFSIQSAESRQWNSGTEYAQHLNFQNYLSLLVILEDAQPNNPETNQYSTLTSNILLATITKNESLDAIFLFELEEPSTTPLFSGAALEEKPITAMYTDTKVDGHSIKLILDSGLAGSIIIKQLIDQLGCRVDCAASAKIITANGTTKTPIDEIDDFPFEVNGIIISIKVLVIEATQYQTLIGNDWLSKTNAILDWTITVNTHIVTTTTNFKVVTTPNTTTLEYYQSIYTHCRQRFNIPDGIEIVKRTLYQYIENHINNYLLGNYNILEYCEEKYPVQSKYSLDFESETETSNKGKQKVKQHAKTTLNTSILSKTTAKHLPEDFQSPRNPTQQQEPISTNTNIIEYLQENKSDHSENLESEATESEQEKATENKEMLKAIPYFLQKTAGKWFENLEEPFENWQAFKDAFLQQFTDNNTSITLCNCFCNIKQETSETILDQFIAGLKDKLIKKVHSHAPADLATAIRYVKNYEMAMEEANHTKLVNLTIRETSSAAEEKIDQLTKKQQYQQPLPIQQYQTQLFQQYQVPARRLVQHNQFTSQNQFQNNNNRINPNNQLVPQNSGQQKPNYFYTQPSYLTMTEESNFQQTVLSEGKTAVPRTNPSNHTILPAQIAQNANLSDIFPFEFEVNESPFLLSNVAANEQKAITAMYTEATVEEKPIQLILDSGLAGSIITYQLMQQLQKIINRPAQTVIVTADDMKKTPVGEIDNLSFTIDGITIPVKVLVMDAPQYQALVKNNWLLKANANLDWETQELKISYQEQHTIVPATCSTFNKQSEKAPVFEFEEEKEMPLTEIYMALGLTSNWAEETEQEIFKEYQPSLSIFLKSNHLYNLNISTTMAKESDQKKHTKLMLDMT